MWYNLFPEVFVAIFKAMRSGDTARAARIHAAFLNFEDATWSWGLKDVFEFLMRKRGLAKQCYRRPLQALNVAGIQTVERELMEKIQAMEKEVNA
jgi:dihydrodipicolinate synthase/N-acetylneuraminate lyase